MSDAHQLQFAQHRVLGRMASDEFIVPLLLGYHREVHRCVDEPKAKTVLKGVISHERLHEIVKDLALLGGGKPDNGVALRPCPNSLFPRKICASHSMGFCDLPRSPAAN